STGPSVPFTTRGFQLTHRETQRCLAGNKRGAPGRSGREERAKNGPVYSRDCGYLIVIISHYELFGNREKAPASKFQERGGCPAVPLWEQSRHWSLPLRTHDSKKQNYA